jgi:hypothetical protein
MIQIKITVKNDHSKLTQSLERHTLLLEEGCPDLTGVIEKMIEDFKGEDPETPIEEVVVTAKMSV